MKLFFVSLLINLFFSCSLEKELQKKNWVNLEYASCLQFKLPCECLSNIEISAIIFDTVKDSMDLYVYEKNSDYNLWRAVKYKDSIKVYEGIGSSVPKQNIIISKDTLIYFNAAGAKQKFINYPQFELLTHPSYLGKINAFLVSQSFSNRGYRFLDSVFSTEAYSFYCNYGLGEVNLISVSGECENKWILEQTMDTINLYKYINSCEGKIYPRKIVKHLIAKYEVNTPPSIIDTIEIIQGAESKHGFITDSLQGIWTLYSKVNGLSKPVEITLSQLIITGDKIELREKNTIKWIDSISHYNTYKDMTDFFLKKNKTVSFIYDHKNKSLVATLYKGDGGIEKFKKTGS